MQRVWFISNINSGGATDEKCKALEAIIQERGLTLAGRTRFPEMALPDCPKLDSERVDTVILFAGDGTINAALCRLADWSGNFLILPGGTMNLLAKALHGSLDPSEIVHAAHNPDRLVALPFVEAGKHRAFVGLIVGPGATWVRAREAARAGRFARMLQAVRIAWRRTFSTGVWVDGIPSLQHGYQAIYVSPNERGLCVAGVTARDWGAIIELGWSFLTGDWLRARAIETATVRNLKVRGRRPVMALFDGEPEMLDPATEINSGLSSTAFITTKPAL